ncbi:MAG: type IX secretion system outer membrane channel protein PorV [Marinifilaceae bacterium]|jgi:hypothetical protein|nr:type IX secretion system outer membrane channel protein PorV [Marinifilaceae bacterium]
MNKKIKLILAIIAIGLFGENSFAQTSTSGANYISTSVPFLTITPDSRAGGMGDAGVATTPDVYSMHWNASKYATIDKKYQVGLSYSPWLRDLDVKDMSLSYLAGYYRLDKNQVLASSLRYFSLGEIVFLESLNSVPTTKTPNEWAFDLAYSRRLSNKWSGAIAFRYIRSDLTQSHLAGTTQTKPGNSFAADISAYYKTVFGAIRSPMTLTYGINISNIGSKISYTTDDEKQFIPTNLRMGVAFNTKMQRKNTILVALEMNKLLVPTPDVGDIENQGDQDQVVVGSKNTDDSVLSGIFSSFGDAPGGFGEEFKEVTWSLGAEFWYLDQFALRAGYFYEHETKGNRKYITAGLGLRLSRFDIDFSYLIPSNANNPLKNTLRIGISANLDRLRY